MEDDLDIMEQIDEFDLTFDVPEVCIQYEQQEDEGCEGGACKI